MYPNVVGYARVSSLEQSQNSHALEQQKQRLKDAGAFDIVEDVRSGATKNRKGFKQLCELVETKQVKEVVITRVDRVARSLIDLRAFAQTCIDNNVNLKILDQNIDLSTPHGKLMLNLLGSVAEWELDLLKSRIEHGIKHQRKQGRPPSVLPFGYKRSEEDTCVPNRDRYKDFDVSVWQVAREIVDTFLKTGNLREAQRSLEAKYGVKPKGKGWKSGTDFPRHCGLSRWLQNPILRGHLAYYQNSKNKPSSLIPDNHVALITPQEWAEIQRHLSIHERKKRRSDVISLPLNGLIQCAKCGGGCFKMQRRARNKVDAGKILGYYWYCIERYEPSKRCKGSKGMDNAKLESLAIQALTKSPESIVAIAHSENSEAESEEIKKLNESLAGLEALPKNSYVEEAISKIKSEIESIRMQKIETDRADSALKSELDTLLGHAKEHGFWEYLRETGDLRRVARQFINTIEIDDKTVTVKLRFRTSIPIVLDRASV